MCLSMDCVPGTTVECGGLNCEGTRTCILVGDEYVWSECSTYNRPCNNIKCCSCMGVSYNPSATYNGTVEMSHLDCPGTVSACVNPMTCTGAIYGYECSAQDTCSIDSDGSTYPITGEDTSLCDGHICGQSTYECTRQAYPCRGDRTEYKCENGICNPNQVRDDSACSGIAACAAPTQIILHKLDYGRTPYIDAPSAAQLNPGNEFPWDMRPCEEKLGYTTFTSGFYHTEDGAYAPYQNGKLTFYQRAYYIDVVPWPSWQDVRYNRNTRRSPLCVGCHVRIGTNQNRWVQYTYPCPKKDWSRITVDLSSTPTDTMGTVNWNRIRYVQFVMSGVYQHACRNNACTANHGQVDYITLSLEGV
jgi:hypothetical protein